MDKKTRRYKHIRNIKTFDNVTIYDIDLTNFDTDETNGADNMIIQKIGDKYFMIYSFIEGNHGNDIVIKEIKERKFLRIICLGKFKDRYAPSSYLEPYPTEEEHLYL